MTRVLRWAPTSKTNYDYDVIWTTVWARLICRHLCFRQALPCLAYLFSPFGCYRFLFINEYTEECAYCLCLCRVWLCNHYEHLPSYFWPVFVYTLTWCEPAMCGSAKRKWHKSKWYPARTTGREWRNKRVTLDHLHEHGTAHTTWIQLANKLF